MRQNSILHFSGNDLLIENAVQRPDRVDVVLAGRQTDPEFIRLCREQRDGITLSARRLLLAHGITLDSHALTWDEENAMLRSEATFRCINDAQRRILDLLSRNMYVAKPHHFHDREPIDADRLHFALKQDHVLMDTTQLDLLPDDPNAQVIHLEGSVGRLQYYPEVKPAKRHKSLLRDRLHMKPGDIDRTSKPVWRQAEAKDQMTGLIGLRIEGFQSRFHSLVFQAHSPHQRTVINSPTGPFYVFDHTDKREKTEQAEAVPFTVFDRRREHLIAEDGYGMGFESLASNAERSLAFFDRLRALSGNDRGKRISAYVHNQHGIDHILRESDPPFIRTNQDLTEEEHAAGRQHKLRTSLSRHSNGFAERSRQASEIRLLEDASKYGMDEGGLLISETFPTSAAREELIARNGFSALQFRYPAGSPEGPYFSRDDYTFLQKLLSHDKKVWWTNDDISHLDANKELVMGTQLQLAQLPDKHSLAFVPPERMDEFMNGVHLACYGTARTLRPEYIEFMEELFARLEDCKNGSPLVCHSGGGPDLSAMGIMSGLARKYGHLSIGHVLGIKKEPRNQYLDGIFPFRNADRGLRQQNMAAAGDILLCVEGGGGSREERGIALTDIALLKGQFPLIMVGTDFYHHEYRQYLEEMRMGTLDDYVVDCVSLVDSAEEAARIIAEYLHTKKVMNIIPEQFISLREEARAQFGRNKANRQKAWNPEAT